MILVAVSYSMHVVLIPTKQRTMLSEKGWRDNSAVRGSEGKGKRMVKIPFDLTFSQ